MNDLQTRPEASAAVAGGAQKIRKKSLFREYAEAIIIAVLLALVIRQFAVQAFTIPSGSMMDTLLIGDYILVNKFLFGAEIPFTDKHLPGLRQPEHGDDFRAGHGEQVEIIAIADDLARHETKMHAPRAHRRQLLVQAQLGELDRDPRVAAPEGGKRRGNQPEGQPPVIADDEFPAVSAGRLPRHGGRDIDA